MAAGDPMLNPFRALFPSRKRRTLVLRAPHLGASLAPAVVLAAGAGAALWWWTQWERGASEDGEGKTAMVDGAPDVSPVLDADAATILGASLGVQADAAPLVDLSRHTEAQA